MELDDFKTVYQARFNQLPGKSEPDLSALLQARSNTAVERILHHMLWEIGSTLALTLLLTLVLITGHSDALRWMCITVLVVGLVQVVSFALHYRQLQNRLQLPVVSVKQHLSGVLSLVRRFMRLYYRYCLISLPISMVIGGIIGATANDADPLVSLFPRQPTLFVLVLILAISAAVIAGVYYSLRWYIHRLYGRYVLQLEGYVNELNELPD